MNMQRHSTPVIVVTVAILAGFFFGLGTNVFAAPTTGLLKQYGIGDFAKKGAGRYEPPSNPINPGWSNNSFGCDSGGAVQFHYETGADSNSIWYECQ
jgi:hypothetical protein